MIWGPTTLIHHIWKTTACMAKLIHRCNSTEEKTTTNQLISRTIISTHGRHHHHRSMEARNWDWIDKSLRWSVEVITHCHNHTVHRTSHNCSKITTTEGTWEIKMDSVMTCSHRSRNKRTSGQSHMIELLGRIIDVMVEEQKIKEKEVNKIAMRIADIIAGIEVMIHSIQVVQKNWLMVLSQHLIISNVSLQTKIDSLNKRIEK